MTEDDRYSVAEFARRYKVREADLAAFCGAKELTPETVLTRDEFKRMLDEFRPVSAVKEPINWEKAADKWKLPKEETVTENRKPFSQWAKVYESKYRLFDAKLIYVKRMANVSDEDEITESEFLSHIRKHLLGKE